MAAIPVGPHRLSRVFAAALFAAALLALLLAGDAEAALVTVGSPLTGPFKVEEIEEGLTAANSPLAEPGALAASPVNGVVIRWHLLDAKPGENNGTFRLRVIHPNPGGTYTGVGTSADQQPASTSLQTFATALPISVGDLVGIDIAGHADIGVRETTKPAGALAWKAPFPDGQTRASMPSEPAELAFNAEVLPPPTVTGLKPANGSFKGNSKVTIAGTNFIDVTAVNFAGVPARAFTVDSEGQITATSPAGRRGAADVTVTNVAGPSPIAASDKFTYLACVVPKLDGKSLKGAKKALRKSHCHLGKVRRRGDATAKSGDVVKQGKQRGKSLAPGTKVPIVLG